jgi:hypothetical protein
MEDEKLARNMGRFVVNLVPGVVGVREVTRIGDGLEDKLTKEQVFGFVDTFVILAMVILGGGLRAQNVITAEVLNNWLYVFAVERVVVAAIGTALQAGRDPKPRKP